MAPAVAGIYLIPTWTDTGKNGGIRHPPKYSYLSLCRYDQGCRVKCFRGPGTQQQTSHTHKSSHAALKL